MRPPGGVYLAALVEQVGDDLLDAASRRRRPRPRASVDATTLVRAERRRRLASVGDAARTHVGRGRAAAALEHDLAGRDARRRRAGRRPGASGAGVCRSMTPAARSRLRRAGAGVCSTYAALLMAPSGLRSSWPSMARNSSLARFAASASARARCSLASSSSRSASARFSSLMSRTSITVPTGVPSSRIGLAVKATGKKRPTRG